MTSVNPPPVNKPITIPFDLPLSPATSPPINSVKKAITIDTVNTVISLIEENRMINAKNVVVTSSDSAIVIQPNKIARKNDAA